MHYFIRIFYIIYQLNNSRFEIYAKFCKTKTFAVENVEDSNLFRIQLSQLPLDMD